jgi:hypothetical protein
VPRLTITLHHDDYLVDPHSGHQGQLNNTLSRYLPPTTLPTNLQSDGLPEHLRVFGSVANFHS